MSGARISNLGEEGKGGLFIGDWASNGDEFALFDLFFESDSFRDRRESTTAAAIAAATAAAASVDCGGDHGSLVEETSTRTTLSLSQ